MKSKELTFWVIFILVMLVGVVITGCSKHDTNNVQDYENSVITTTENIENPVNTAAENYEIPVIIATEKIDGASAATLSFGYSWTDSKNGAVADGIPVWQGEYTDKNTLIIDGEMGQNMITLSAEKSAKGPAVEGLAAEELAEGLAFASYVIYLPDGTVYDDGTRSPFSSLSPRLLWSINGSNMGIIAPFEPGEYIYELIMMWDNDKPQVTYGIKLIMTGQRNAYDEALDVVWKHYNGAVSVSLEGTEMLPGSEYAGECYVFAAETLDGIVRVAVSKEQYILFEYIDDLWIEYAEYYAQAHRWIDYYKGDMPSNDVAEWELPEFSGVTFRWTQYGVFATEGVNERELFSGMPVWSVYFSDLNGDGLPEICSTTSYGSGMIDTRVIVYDYTNDRLYELADRGIFDYYISFVDDRLFVTQSRYAVYKDETTIATGELVIIDGELIAVGIDREPDKSVSAVYSDDGKYKIEGYGIDYSIVVSGENPVKEIRIVEISSGKTVWNTVGLYLLYEAPNFCWSPDSRYVSIMYAGRIWVDAMLVDTKDMSEHSLPGLFEISRLFPEFSPREDRPDPYLIPEYWIDNHTIVVAFSWVPESGSSLESDRIEIKYQYDINTEELTVIDVVS